VITIPEDREILQKIAATGGNLSKNELGEIALDLLEKAAEGTHEYLKSIKLAIILKESDSCVSQKIRECMADGKSQDQAIAIAMSECGEDVKKDSASWEAWNSERGERAFGTPREKKKKEGPEDDPSLEYDVPEKEANWKQGGPNRPFGDTSRYAPKDEGLKDDPSLEYETDTKRGTKRSFGNPDRLKKMNGCHDPSCGKFCETDSVHNFKLLPSEGTNVAILKTVEDQQIIFGIALQPAPFVDFLVKSRAVGYRHKEMLEKRADVIESYVAPTDINWNGNVIKEGSWVVGVKIHDKKIWELVKNKELNAFSIGGKGKRTAVNSL
jgi:hypothetical protein